MKNGIPEAVANEIYDDMVSFASYAFNKSHAACYAYVAFQTAYLKCHYPREFMAALLTSVLDSTAKVIEYSSECQRLGIKVLPPDINVSRGGFTVERSSKSAKAAHSAACTISASGCAATCLTAVRWKT